MIDVALHFLGSMVVVRQVASSSHGFCWRACDFVNERSSVTSSRKAITVSCRKVCSIRATLHPGGSSAVKRRTIKSRNLPRRTPNSGLRNERLILGPAISFISLSWKNGLRTLHCKAVGLSTASKTPAVAQDERLSDKFGEIPSSRMDSTSDLITLATSTSSPPRLTEEGLPVNLVIGAGVTAAVFIMAVFGFMAKPHSNRGGSVSDLIKRGQLRTDRGDSRILTFDDPFNNPLVKMGNKNPIVRMCGKIFRPAPVTLTQEKVEKHRNRRIQAYKWKRPVVFLNEGDPVPEGMDPEEVRWIPTNHPFATTSNYIDENLAQKNVYQRRGVPSSVQAEHEALCKKNFETMQGEEPEFQLSASESTGVRAWKNFKISDAAGSLFEDDDTPSDSASCSL